MLRHKLAGPALLFGLLVLPMAGHGPAAVAAPARQADYTLAGTTVSRDEFAPVPGVRIIVMPESTVTVSDSDGDFFVPWDGRQGWVTFIAEERTRDGKEWCKRRTLPAASDSTPGPLVDLGPIRVTPKIPLHYLQMPTLPKSHPRPAVIHAAGPAAGQPDTCHVRLSYATDLWGRVTRVGTQGGDTPPAGLQEALFAWVRSVPFVVSMETACEAIEPFQALDPMDYVWSDSAWVYIPYVDPGIRMREALGHVPSR